MVNHLGYHLSFYFGIVEFLYTKIMNKQTATEKWIEERFRETWEGVETDIDFSQHNPTSNSSSLHVYEERYNIEGKTYRLLYPLSDSGAEPIIEVLKSQ
jgi:hypothetical protein